MICEIFINTLRWIGHMERTEKTLPTKQIFYQRLVAVDRGRPEISLKDQMEMDLRKLNITN